MATTKEYTKKVIVTLDQIRKMKAAQNYLKNNGIDPGTTTENLQGLLTGVASVLSYVFSKSVPGTIAVTFATLLLDLAHNEKAVIAELVQHGIDGMDEIETFMENNTKYSRIEINVPYLEYVTEGVTIIQGAPVVTRVYSGNGWIIM